jgi:hypothetical protein
MDDQNKHICEKLRVRRTIIPFTGWAASTRYTTIPELISEFGYKVGAEIGVSKAAYTKVIFDKNPSLKMYCIDPWTRYWVVRNQERQNRYQVMAKETLKDFDVQFLVKTSKEALVDIADNSLDFVYIDALHDFDNVMFDIIEWSRKVRTGGMVSGHDFVYFHDCGVIPAVEAYTRAHNINPWFITNEGLPQPPSWFWVKK